MRQAGCVFSPSPLKASLRYALALSLGSSAPFGLDSPRLPSAAPAIGLYRKEITLPGSALPPSDAGFRRAFGLVFGGLGLRCAQTKRCDCEKAHPDFLDDMFA